MVDREIRRPDRSAAAHDRRDHAMKRFVIERNIPGAGNLTAAELADISKTAIIAATSLGVPYRWVTSYVTGDKIYCVHEADDEDVVREHARRCGLPATTVALVVNEIGAYTEHPARR
jgi:hypothetical protein